MTISCHLFFRRTESVKTENFASHATNKTIRFSLSSRRGWNAALGPDYVLVTNVCKGSKEAEPPDTMFWPTPSPGLQMLLPADENRWWLSAWLRISWTSLSWAAARWDFPRCTDPLFFSSTQACSKPAGSFDSFFDLSLLLSHLLGVTMATRRLCSFWQLCCACERTFPFSSALKLVFSVSLIWCYLMMNIYISICIYLYLYSHINNLFILYTVYILYTILYM